jgi:hypothetical protein
MAFPTSPVNGQQATVNNIVYTYSSASNSWTRTPEGFVNIAAGGYISAIGNVYGNYIIGNGSQLTGLPAGYANSNAVAYGEAGWAGNIIPSANNVYSLGSPTAQWASVYIGNATLYLGDTAISANNTSNTLLVGSNVVVTTTSSGNIITPGFVSATGNVTGGNVLTAGLMSSTGNAIHGNILTAGLISATGNVTGNYFVGNGSALTGISSGNSSINITVTTISANYTIASGQNGLSVGPVTTGNNVQVSVASGQRWIIL